MEPTEASTSSILASVNTTVPEAGSVVGSCALGLVFSAIALVAMVGNTLVLIIYISNHHLQTVTNCFLVSLATSDLLLAALVLPLAIKVEVTGTWNLGQLLCDLWVTLDVFLCTASILNLCCISLDRNLAIIRPLWYKAHRSRRLAYRMIGAVWVLSAIVTCPPLLGWKENGRGTDPLSCYLTSNPGYIIYSALGSFYIPLVFMLVVNGHIFLAVYRQVSEKSNLYKQTSNCSREYTADPDQQCVSANETRDEVLSANVTEASETDSSYSKTETQSMLPQKTTNCHTKVWTKIVNSTVPLIHLGHISMNTTYAEWITKDDCRVADVLPKTNSQFSNRKVIKCNSLTIMPTVYEDKEITVEEGQGNHHPTIPVRHRLLEAKDSLLSTERRTSWGRNQDPCRVKVRTARSLFIIVGGFAVCWMPFFVLYIVEPFCLHCRASPALKTCLTWLGYFNSALNPFIYVMCIDKFRKALCTMVKVDRNQALEISLLNKS